MGARAVLVKGGHRAIESEAVDILLTEDGRFTEFREEYIDVGEVHGSGCTLSAAIAACLGKGMTLEEAVGAAKSYVTKRSNQRLASATAPHLYKDQQIIREDPRHSIVTFSIFTSDTGRSFRSVCVVAIALTTSCPSVTLPKIV